MRHLFGWRVLLSDSYAVGRGFSSAAFSVYVPGDIPVDWR